MKFFLLISALLFAGVVLARDDTMIPVGKNNQRGFVNAEDLLEKSLEQILIRGGAFFVNVDEKNARGRFNIGVCYSADSKQDDESEASLQSALEQLGYTDFEIVESRQNIYKRYFDCNIDTFNVFFNTETMIDQMSATVRKTLRYSDLSIEDDDN